MEEFGPRLGNYHLNGEVAMCESAEAAGKLATGAPETEIEITPAMIEAGLTWLYTYEPERSDSADVVRSIIRAAVAILRRL